MEDIILENSRYKKEDFEKIIYSVYENDGLIRKIRSKENISRDLLEQIIEELTEFNEYIEKDEIIAKFNIEYLMGMNLNIYNLEFIINDLDKNDFDIDFKFKNKIEVAKYIRKIYLEKKWLNTSYYSFLITSHFKSFQRIKKIKVERNGIVLCFNENNEIVCVYLFCLYDDVVYDLIYLYNKSGSINIEKELNKLSLIKIRDEECCICRDRIEEGIKLNCNHVFHKTCIKEWFKVNKTCPLCRAKFIDKITRLINIKEKYDLDSLKKYIFENKII